MDICDADYALKNIPDKKATPASRVLLKWYDRHKRVLPWRVASRVKADPYKIWLSEIMLQQTTVAAVKPYYENFLKRWPDIHALAAAASDDLMAAWAGLGYYARARNLHACAKAIVRDYGGHFPQSEEELFTLPGIGPYTAAAISAIAFGRPAVVVDGNVERVIARLFAVEMPLPAAKAHLRALCAQLTPQKRTGDFAQAMMDLGATICTPRAPNCSLCPLQTDCAARASDIQNLLPRRAPRKVRPEKRAGIFWLRRADGAVLLRKRGEKGLLGGMMEMPSSPWTDVFEEAAVLACAPARVSWQRLPGCVRHVFTHFALELTVYHACVSNSARAQAIARAVGGKWFADGALSKQALPSLMRKVAEHARAFDADSTGVQDLSFRKARRAGVGA